MSRRLLLGLGALLAGCDEGEDYVAEPKPEPILRDDSYTIAEDDAGTINKTKLLANDEHIPYTGSFDIATEPQHGTFGSGYIPDPGYFGPDSFTYSVTANDGTKVIARVDVMVTSDGLPYESAVRLDTGSAWGVAAGDIDGDGKIDLVTAEAETSSVVVLANRSTGPGAYAVQPFGFEGGHAPVGVAIADVDDDGRLDVISAAKDDGLVVLRNITVTGGPISFAGPIYLPARNAVAVVTADLNGDGLVDLAAIDDYDDDVLVWLNATVAGVTAFGARTAFATPDGPLQLIVDDADGNGTADLAVLARTTGELSLFLNATAAGATTPVFAARLDRSTGTNPSGMFLADLDADGDQEIAVLHDSESLWIYANRNATPGSPSFEAARTIDLPMLSSTADKAVIAPVDLDGQGGLDMMLATQGSSPSTFLTNRSTQQGAYAFDIGAAKIGDLKLRKRVTYGRPTGVLFAELDGAPPQEIVVTARREFSGDAGTFVLFGR